jgi:hypothetical protein
MTCCDPEEPPRYAVQREPSGSWMVVDSLTLLPAATDGRDLVGLAKEDAQDIARELNSSVAEGRDPLI